MAGKVNATMQSRSVLVFLDGVGLGEPDPAINPIVAAQPAFLLELLGIDELTARTAPSSTNAASLFGVDATLGVPGLPQSGTGQYSLLTGDNGALQFGRHYGPYVPTALREPLMRNSLLARAIAAGHDVAFANAYPEELIGTGERISIRGPLRAGPPLAAIGANVLRRRTRDLETGNALASEITNEGWIERLGRTSLPHISAADAGRNLAAIASKHELTFFAHYSTDAEGHLRDLHGGIRAMQRVDEFLRGFFETIEPDVTVLIASDHGNLEDIRVGHTLNPAMFIAAGPFHEQITANIRSLTDVAPSLLRIIDE